MKITRINPPGSPTPRNYHHVVSVEGGRTVYLAGQIAFDENRNIVGGNDIIAQTHHGPYQSEAKRRSGRRQHVGTW